MDNRQLKPVSVEDLSEKVGQPIGVSSWRTVTQDMIDRFAEATDDHQFIHVDPARAAETAFGGTIAHGFLVLSLLSSMAYEAIPPLEGADLNVNQGMERMRFFTPVRTGARVRARFVLARARIRPSGWVELTYETSVDIENSPKPALTADWQVLVRLGGEAG